MQQGFFRSVVILCHDVTLAGVCLIVAFVLHTGAPLDPWAIETLLVYWLPVVVVSAGLTFYLCGLHRRVWSYTSTADLIAIARASLWLTLLLIALWLAAGRPAAVPTPVLAIQWLLLVVALGAARLAYRCLRAHRLSGPGVPAPGTRTPVLVYGCGPMTPLLVHAVHAAPGSGLRVVGIIDELGDRVGRMLAQAPVLGRAGDLERILVDLAVHGVPPQRMIVTTPRAGIDHAARLDLESACARHGLRLDDLHDALGIEAAPPASAPPPAADLPDLYTRLRRFVDIIASALALVVLAPVLALVALAVLIDLGPPVLFRQTRPGRELRPFTLYKFRTMGPACDAFATLRPDAARTTALGRFLRRARLDELPQLANVLRGDMSLIGPRPLLPRDLPPVPSAEFAARAALRPGITGWAQVNGGHRLAMADKLALDLWYVEHAGPGLDLRIAWRTLVTVVFGETIDHAALARARTAREPRADASTGGAEIVPLRAPAAPEPAADRDRPRLVLVNRYFYPDCSATAQLLTDLVEALDRRGCPMVVLTGRQRYDDPASLLPARDRFGGAEVRRLRTTRFGRASLPGRALDYASFYAAALLALLRTARRGDVLLVETDPPLISTVAWLAARLKGARLVNWCQDLFPETAAALGVGFARGQSGRLLRALRNRSLQGAALNVVLSRGMALRLRAEGVPEARIRVIHNWADGARIRPLAPEHNPLRHDWDLAGRFVLGYSGNLGRVHDAHALVALMAALEDEPDLLTLFIGAGNGYRELRDLFAGHGIANVRFRPYQPREHLGWSLTVPDLHLVSLKPACEGLVMPSKLYGILAAGRPIAFIGDPEGDAARLVREADAGLIAAPGNIAGLAEAIRALRADPARLAELGANARRAYEHRFSKDASLDAWLGHLAALGAPCAAAPHAEAAGEIGHEREAVAIR